PTTIRPASAAAMPSARIFGERFERNSRNAWSRVLTSWPQRAWLTAARLTRPWGALGRSLPPRGGRCPRSVRTRASRAGPGHLAHPDRGVAGPHAQLRGQPELLQAGGQRGVEAVEDHP